MTFSTFTRYFSENRRNVPASFAQQIRREAISRYQERLNGGRADCVLDFSDLIMRMENEIAGK